MCRKLAVIGVGNMAKAIIAGIISSAEDQSTLSISDIIVFDKNCDQYGDLKADQFHFTVAASVADAVGRADCVLLSVKPQNYPDILAEIAAVDGHEDKLYLSIGAGITVESVSRALNGASVVRVLPNVPMLIGKGVSVICRNPAMPKADFDFACEVFRCSGSFLLIEESEMNRMIGVTSSSPAYVFRFIRAMYEGALAQGLEDKGDLLNSICDVMIGSAYLMKGSSDTPDELIAKVASKGGTTERALKRLDEAGFDAAIVDAMKDCTARADELGNAGK